jgi:hypothetical protein
MVSISECFSESYAEARTKFCSAAASGGRSIRSWFNPTSRDRTASGSSRHARDSARRRQQHAGADLEHARRRGPLRLGRADRLAGDRRAAKLPKDTGALIVHAINPHGFAWTRRVNEDNVDLNRNFVDHDKAYPKNDGYLAIADAVLPLEWTRRARPRASAPSTPTPRSTAPTLCRVRSAAGSTPIPTASSSAAPEPTWSNRTIRAIAREELGRARRVGIIDFHTGLGPFGHGELICAVPPTAKSFPAREGVVRRRADLARGRHLDLRHRGRHHDGCLSAGAARRRGDSGRHRIRHLFGA